MNLIEYVAPTIAFIRANQIWVAPIVFALAFGENLLFLSFLVPATVIMVAVGGLIGAYGLDIWPVWLAAGTGSAFGSSVSYWVGLYFKDSTRSLWPLTRYPEWIPKGQRYFERYGILSIFLGNFFGPLRAIIFVVAGMNGMRQLQFHIANIAASFIWATWVLVPAAFGMQWFGRQLNQTDTPTAYLYLWLRLVELI